MIGVTVPVGPFTEKVHPTSVTGRLGFGLRSPASPRRVCRWRFRLTGRSRRWVHLAVAGHRALVARQHPGTGTCTHGRSSNARRPETSPARSPTRESPARTSSRVAAGIASPAAPRPRDCCSTSAASIPSRSTSTDWRRSGRGARLAQVYDALHERGRTVPAGCGPTVGIAGLTVGGGLGLLGRRHGLTCDALVGAQVVLADGRRVDCDADQEPELFWALRGAAAGSSAWSLRSSSPPCRSRCGNVHFIVTTTLPLARPWST